MSRIEEFNHVIETNGELSMGSIELINAMFIDIAKSLAVIADKLSERDTKEGDV